SSRRRRARTTSTWAVISTRRKPPCGRCSRLGRSGRRSRRGEAMSRTLLTLAIAIAASAIAADPPNDRDRLPVPPFSIGGIDPEKGELGVAVQSKFFSVGSVVPWARAGVGAIATQSFANTTFGPRGLDMLAAGCTAQQTLDKLIEMDEGRDTRQLGIVD